MAKISVIVPIYNMEEYLPLCLDSLLAQTEKDLEILAVNNGCTDGCAGILDAYAKKDNRIKIINRVHGKVADARNSALAVAEGEYVAFCDSDDTVPENAYENLLKKAEETGCDVVVGSYMACSDYGERELILLPVGKNISDFKLALCPPCVWNKLIKRSFLIGNELAFPALIMGEDVAFIARLLRCDPKTERILQPVYNYWNHSKAGTPSMTHRYSLEYFKLHLQCRETLLAITFGSQYQTEAEEYVYLDMIYFLRAFLFRIWDGDERKEAFDLFRKHVLEFDWISHQTHFESIFNIKLEQFYTICAEDYFARAMEFNHREIVLNEYYAGLIGFRYILKYIKAWVHFKISRVGKRIK